MPKTFVISDTHFGHKNIIRYANRPFSSVLDMDESIIERWNATVGNQDTVIHLGDVGFHYSALQGITSRLNGHKLLVRGNHDWGVERMSRLGFDCLTTFKTDVCRFHAVHDRIVIAAHRPQDLPTWNENELSSWGVKHIVLCGHEHDNYPIFIKWIRDKGDKARPIMAMNMSCEHWGYAPVNIEQIAALYDEELNKYI